MAEEKTIFNQNQAADYIAARYKKMDAPTLSRLTNNGGGPAFTRLGNQKIFRRWDLDRWIAQQKEADAASSASA